MAPEQLAGQRGHGAQRHLRARSRALRDLHRPARARRQEPRGADPQARAVRHPAADRDREEPRSEDRARDPALPASRTPTSVPRRRSPSRRRCPAAIRSRRRSPRAKRRRRRWSRPPACREALSAARDGRGGRVDRAVARWRSSLLVSARDPDQPPADAEASRGAAGSRAGSPRALGYDRRTPVDDAIGLGLSRDYVRYIAATSTAPDRWNSLRTVRPETFFLWYRTSPQRADPVGRRKPGGRREPAADHGGHGADPRSMPTGRLSEFSRRADPASQPDSAVAAGRLEEALRCGRTADARRSRRWRPGWCRRSTPTNGVAWEGPLPERPDHTVRIEAAAHRRQAGLLRHHRTVDAIGTIASAPPPSLFTRIDRRPRVAHHARR